MERFCTVLLLLVSQVHGLGPEVKTPLGAIIGTTKITRHGRNISAFLTIPYAIPPVGPLRFKNPVPVEPWKGRLWADVEPEACTQVTEDGLLDGTEDCLHLNVFTPQLAGDKLLPTMVYIHGGGFQSGNAKTNFLGPDYILEKDVVLVTLQYRLSVLGFMSTGDAAAPGNFGLKDQALAIKWVHDNIKYFGGDPDKVTLFGQSAGSVSVNFQVLSSASKGMFHQYITQSGVALCPWAFMFSSDYKNYSFALGKVYNCSTNSTKDLVECLREVPARDLVSVTGIFSGLQTLTRISWVPTDEPDIEGAFIVEHPLKMILKNKFMDLPNISGVVRDEGLLVTMNLYANETLYDSLVGDIDQFLLFLAGSFVSGDGAGRLASNLRKFYFDQLDVHNETQVLQGMTKFMTDVSIVFPQVLQLQLISKRTVSPCYFYSFEYRGTVSKTAVKMKSNEDLGVTHGDDLIYLFPSELAYFNLPDIEMDETDQRMIDIIVDLWTNFAATGEPTTNLTQDPHMWRPYTQHDSHLRIGSNGQATLSSENSFLDDRMHFWAMQILKLVFWSF